MGIEEQLAELRLNEGVASLEFVTTIPILELKTKPVHDKGLMLFEFERYFRMAYDLPLVNNTVGCPHIGGQEHFSLTYTGCAGIVLPNTKINGVRLSVELLFAIHAEHGWDATYASREYTAKMNLFNAGKEPDSARQFLVEQAKALVDIVSPYVR